MIDAEYVNAYSDGLNSHYVAKEHDELLESFKYAPNVFDGFRLHSHIESEQRAVESEQRLSQSINATLHYQQQIHNIFGSVSWKVSKPSQ